jgi:hypothetical protein
MKNCKAIACSLLTVFFASAASAGLQNAITVPWEGDITKFHTAVAGQQIILKGVLWATNPPTPTSVSYQWNPGDGSAFTTLATVSVTPGTPYPVSLNYTYSGSAGTPYVAWLIASDGTVTISNRYLVMLQAPSLDANINIAIDDGLWWLYQNATFSSGSSGVFQTFDGSPCAAWTSYAGMFHASPTAGAVQAFEINGSLQTGNFNQDPYAQAVAYGLNFILKGWYESSNYPMLQAVNITTGGTTGEGNPDGNGNGIGIETYDAYYSYSGTFVPVYQGGAVVDALIASGTPNASTGRIFTGTHVATFGDVVQDMLDMYAWGQYTGTENFNVLTPNPPVDLTSYGTPTSLTFVELATDCGAEGTFTYKVNGITVGTVTPTNNCSCSPGFNTLVVSGATLTSAWSAATPATIEVSYTGGYYVSSAAWILDFGGTTFTNPVYLAPGLHGINDSDLCDGYTEVAFDVVNPINDIQSAPTTTATSGIIGAWRYTWGNSSSPDNSTAQWAAIASIPARQSPWNCVIPSFETNYDNNWLWYSYADQNSAWGKFGYQEANQFLSQTSPPGGSETPSGLVQLNADGFPTNEYRWMKVENYFQNNWDTGEAWFSDGIANGENGVSGNGNFYSIYSFTKSQRTANPNPVVNFPNGFDWYRGSTGHDGIATAVSKILMANSGAWPGTYWEGQELSTAWAVIVLNPNLFSAGPVACFSANPNPGFANVPISFDPTCSSDPNPGGIANLVKFDWNWGDGTADTITTTPDVVPHAFACTTLPCSYQVTLTVYDNSNPQLSASAQQTIRITQPPHPPVSVPGGPYIVSLCSCDSLTLDGSGSFSPDAGLHQENCNTCPPDGITAYGWALTGVPYTYTGSTEEIVSLGNTFTTYFPTANTYEIGLEVTDNAAKSFPDGTTSNLVGTAFTSVTVYNCGPTVTVTPGCQSVAVSWNNVGASSYSVLSSTTGPNSGFTVAATLGAGATSTSISATLGETQWIRVQAVTANGTTMSCAAEAVNTFVNCVCISDLTAQSKATIVELEWPLVEGVNSYNVYRSTAPNVNMIPANRVATGVGTSHGLYVDGGLTNGKTYYYRISAVVDGVETCRSIEISAVPAAVKR